MGIRWNWWDRIIPFYQVNHQFNHEINIVYSIIISGMDFYDVVRSFDPLQVKLLEMNGRLINNIGTEFCHPLLRERKLTDEWLIYLNIARKLETINIGERSHRERLCDFWMSVKDRIPTRFNLANVLLCEPMYQND